MGEDLDIVFGLRQIRGQNAPFGLSHKDRRFHCYVIGKTGTGKTTLLKNLIVQDIEAGRGLGVIDPHGDLAYDLLDFIPRRCVEDVAYFDPADPDYAVGFNLLSSKDDRNLVASAIVSSFRGIWREFTDARNLSIIPKMQKD